MSEYRQENWPSANSQYSILIDFLIAQGFHLVEVKERSSQNYRDMYEWCENHYGEGMLSSYESGSSRLCWSGGRWTMIGVYPPGDAKVFFEDRYEAMEFAMRWR